MFALLVTSHACADDELTPAEFFSNPDKTRRAKVTLASGVHYFGVHVRKVALPWVSISYTARRAVGERPIGGAVRKKIWIQLSQVAEIEIEEPVADAKPKEDE